MTRKIVRVGTEFEISAVEVEIGPEIIKSAADAATTSGEQKMRGRIAVAVLIAIAVAVSVAALVGWCSGDYTGLNAVWSATAVPLGGVLGHYFKGTRS